MHEVDLDESIDDPDELYLRWPQHNTPRVRNSISILDEDFESGEMARAPPFDVDDELNRCLTLARGARLGALGVDAVVVGNNEALSDRSHHTGDVFARGGPSLAREVAALEGCRTGEAKLTRGHDLPARHVVHTVGPRYQARYTDAAESALHWCYRGSLQLCAEAGARSVALAPLHTERKGYPLEAGAHVALRTLRKFLERHRGAFDHVILAVGGGESGNGSGELAAYEAIAPLYFPRTAAEADASARELPAELGDADGEVIFAERLITIGASPGSGTGGGGGNSTPHKKPARVPRGFGDVAASPDGRKLTPRNLDVVGDVGRWLKEVDADGDGDGDEEGDGDGGDAAKQFLDAAGKYQAAREAAAARAAAAAAARDAADYTTLMRRAREAAASAEGAAMRKSAPAYVHGQDGDGRPVLVVVGARVHARRLAGEEEALVLHLLAEVEPLMRAPFTVLFVAAEMGSDSGKTFDFLRALLHRFRAIHLRVAAFYLLHPTLKMRFTFAILGAVLWGKLHHVDSLAQLHEHFEKGQLRLPAFVFAADERRQGGGASSRAEPPPPPPPSAAAERDLSAAERAQLRWGQQAAEVAAAPAPVLRAPSAPRTMTMARSGANVYSPLYDTGPLN